MRELTALEIQQVSGGSIVGDYATEGGAYGSIAGALITNTMRGAVTGGLAGALLGATFGLTYGLTSYALENFS